MTFRTLIEAFVHQVDSQPDAAAVIFQSSAGRIESNSWRQLALQVGACARHLSRQFDSDRSVPRRIGHTSDNSLADLVIALACMSLGAVEVPIDHRLSQQEIQKRWNRVGGLWLDHESRQRLTSAALTEGTKSQKGTAVSAADLAADAASLILWTSGTTGQSQGATLSHRNLLGNAAAKLKAVPQYRDDIRLCVLPLSHAYARTCDFGTWLLSGCTLAVTLGYGGLSRLAPMIRPTLINMVPSLANRLLGEPQIAELGLDRLRLLGCGGAAMSESAFQQWKDRGVTVIQGYGLTEASPVICSATPESASPGLVGHLVDGWEQDIRDGQLFVRGPHTMLGYWGNELATAEKIDDEGWLATGDLVQPDASTGQLRILGRIDDVIVLDSGNKVSPSAIEREVEQVIGVQHAVLIQDNGLQLWFDSDLCSDQQTIEESIRGRLQQFPECNHCTVHRFAPPLCEAAGELTVKGTIRRGRILETRFSDQAGS